MIKSIAKKHYALGVFLLFSLTIITLSISFNYLSENILTKYKVGIYNKEFWINLLINLNSSIIDFLFLGLAILYFDKKREEENEAEKSQKNLELKEQSLRRELEDYAEHSTLELDLKKAGIIHELCKINKNTINTKKIMMHGISLKNIDLINSDLSGLSLYQSKIENVTFEKCIIRSLNMMEVPSKMVKFTNCKIRNLKLTNGRFKAIHFEDCYLVNSRMNNADLSSSIFFNCDMQDVTFEKSNLRSANFLGCSNINIESLCKADCLDYIVAEEDVIARVRLLRPDAKMKNQTTSGNRTTVTQP